MLRNTLFALALAAVFWQFSGCDVPGMNKFSAVDTTEIRLDSVATISVNVVNGTVKLRTSQDVSESRCTIIKKVWGRNRNDAQKKLKEFKIVADIGNGGFSVVEETPERFHVKRQVDIELTIPASSRKTDISIVNGNVDMACRADSILVSVVNGNVLVKGESRLLSVDVVNGRIDFDGIFDTLKADMVNGGISGTLNNIDYGEMDNVNGSIILKLMDINDIKVVASALNRRSVSLDGFDSLVENDDDVIGVLGTGTERTLKLSTVTGKISVSVEKHLYALK